MKPSPDLTRAVLLILAESQRLPVTGEGRDRALEHILAEGVRVLAGKPRRGKR